MATTWGDASLREVVYQSPWTWSYELGMDAKADVEVVSGAGYCMVDQG